VLIDVVSDDRAEMPAPLADGCLLRWKEPQDGRSGGGSCGICVSNLQRPTFERSPARRGVSHLSLL